MSPKIRDLHLKDKTKGFFGEFKSFILKGNAIDLAVGVVIGAAFNELVNSLVKDIILGAITTIAHQPDFSTWAYGSIRYGAFLNTVLNLIIVGFSVFVTIKFVHRLGRRNKVEEAEETKQ